tara:strand:+ start:97 stop:504 length:408 start_codon:yes stop_codon:yes gene_type:complete
MKLPTNGVAKQLRSYFGSLIIFFFIIGIIIAFIQFPVLDTNKEVVMMLVGTLAASLSMVISTLTGRDPHDVDALKSTIEKKEQQIEFLVKAKDDLESMVINLQKQMLENLDHVVDKVILKAAIDFDEKYHPSKKD